MQVFRDFLFTLYFLFKDIGFQFIMGAKWSISLLVIAEWIGERMFSGTKSPAGLCFKKKCSIWSKFSRCICRSIWFTHIAVPCIVSFSHSFTITLKFTSRRRRWTPFECETFVINHFPSKKNKRKNTFTFPYLQRKFPMSWLQTFSKRCIDS